MQSINVEMTLFDHYYKYYKCGNDCCMVKILYLSHIQLVFQRKKHLRTNAGRKYMSF